MMQYQRSEGRDSGVYIERIAFLDTGREFEILSRDDWRGVALRPLVEDMGLAWSAQRQKVMSDTVLNSTVSIIDTVAQDGKTRETICMDIQMVPWFLGTINENKVKSELRDRVLKYKRHAAKILFDATFGKALQRLDSLQDEVERLRHYQDTLPIQLALFGRLDQLSERARIRGLQAAYSGSRVSMSTACRILKNETGFDAWEVRDKIRDMGGRATLLDVVCRHGYEKDVLAILTQLIQPPTTSAGGAR